jgi:excisionase family DNA binding protein
MAAYLHTTTRPDPTEITAAAGALPQIQAFLHGNHEATVGLRVEDGGTTTSVVLPRSVIELLTEVLLHMAEGRVISIAPTHAELTTQQAADLLCVSRPFLVDLLTSGAIPHRRVGSHRRVKAEDVLAYRSADDEPRRAVADGVFTLTEELGLD